MTIIVEPDALVELFTSNFELPPNPLHNYAVTSSRHFPTLFLEPVDPH